MTWSFVIPAPRHLNLNSRDHWSVDADIKAEWRMLAKAQAKAARIPKGIAPIRVELHATAPDRRRRDADNLFPNLKPVVDGLVDAGVVPDDTPDHVTDHTIRLHRPDSPDGRWYWAVVVRRAE